MLPSSREILAVLLQSCSAHLHACSAGNVLLKTHRIDRRGYIAKVSDFGESPWCNWQLLQIHTLSIILARHGANSRQASMSMLPCHQDPNSDLAFKRGLLGAQAALVEKIGEMTSRCSTSLMLCSNKEASPSYQSTAGICIASSPCICHTVDGPERCTRKLHCTLQRALLVLW